MNNEHHNQEQVQAAPSIHDLKTWPQFFEALLAGTKTFEVRKADRAFKVGDKLLLREWDDDPWKQGYTGRTQERTISYVMHGGAFGVDSEFCVLGFDMAAHCRRLEQRVADQDAHVSTCHRILAGRDAKLEALDMANEDNALKARLSDERWAKAEAALAAAKASRKDGYKIADELRDAVWKKPGFTFCGKNYEETLGEIKHMNEVLAEYMTPGRESAELAAAQTRITELEKQRDRYPMYSVTRIKELEAALTAHEESLGAAQAEIADLKNAGGPPFIRSEAIRNLKDDLASARAKLAKLEEEYPWRLKQDYGIIESLEKELAAARRQLEEIGAKLEAKDHQHRATFMAYLENQGIPEEQAKAETLRRFPLEAALAPVVERGAEQKEAT